MSARVKSAALAFAIAAAGCAAAPGEGIATGGEFGMDATVAGSFGKSAVIGGTTTAYPLDYGAYDYRTRSYGGTGFRTRCVRLSPYTGQCAAWRES
jgi:hypothetical protein